MAIESPNAPVDDEEVDSRINYTNTFFESVIVAENVQNRHREVQLCKCL